MSNNEWLKRTLGRNQQPAPQHNQPIPGPKVQLTQREPAKAYDPPLPPGQHTQAFARGYTAYDYRFMKSLFGVST